MHMTSEAEAVDKASVSLKCTWKLGRVVLQKRCKIPHKTHFLSLLVFLQNASWNVGGLMNGRNEI